MTIALFSWLGSASVLSRSLDFPLFLLMFYAEKWPPSSVIVLHLMTHSTAASSYYPNVKVWTPLLEGLKKVFICTPLSAGNKKIWLMENAKLLKRFCADEPNPRHCCKKTDPRQRKTATNIDGLFDLLNTKLSIWPSFILSPSSILGCLLKSSHIKALIFTSPAEQWWVRI